MGDDNAMARRMLREGATEPQQWQRVVTATDRKQARFPKTGILRMVLDAPREDRRERRSAGTQQATGNLAGLMHCWSIIDGSPRQIDHTAVRLGRRFEEIAVDGTGSWWGDHWSEVVAVALASGFLVLIGTAVRSSLMLGQSAVNRRVRHRRASDAAAVERSRDDPKSPDWKAAELRATEFRVSLHQLERRVSLLEAALERATGEETDPDERSVLATLSTGSSTVQDRVEQLARDGHTVEDIARTLNEPIGRIELILNLRRASGQS